MHPETQLRRIYMPNTRRQTKSRVKLCFAVNQVNELGLVSDQHVQQARILFVLAESRLMNVSSDPAEHALSRI